MGYRKRPPPADPFAIQRTRYALDQHVADSLGPEFERLQRSLTPHPRGREFELLLLTLLRLSGFEAERNATIAEPRQTDLLAKRDGATYVIEAKWEKHPIDIDVIDALQARLQRSPRGSIGCVFSMSGFTKTAIERPKRLRSVEGGGFEVLLFDPIEIASLFFGHWRLRDTVRQKLDHLRDRGEAGGTLFLRGPEEISLPSLNIPLPTPLVERRARDAPLAGDAYNFAFGKLPSAFDGYAPEVSAFEVFGDPDVSTIDDLRGLLHLFHSQLRLFGHGGYAITELKSERIWFGTRADHLLDDLVALPQRYERAAIETSHHSEEFTIYDVTRFGALAISGRHNVSTRQLYGVSFELRLPGIPLDMGPLQTVMKRLGHLDDYIAPIEGSVVTRIEVPHPTLVDPIEYLSDTHDAEFYAGAVAKNPFYQMTANDDVPHPLPGVSFLVGQVGDHLAETERVHKFRLRHLQLLHFRHCTVFDVFFAHDADLRYNVVIPK